MVRMVGKQVLRECLGYILHQSLSFFTIMNLACVRPIFYNFTYLLSSCSTISDLCRGREMDDAHKMFDRMPARDLVAWNTVVSGYLQNRLALQALDTVLRLQADGKMLDSMGEGLIQKAKDGGLDVVETNIFRNGHEPSPGSVISRLLVLGL